MVERLKKYMEYRNLLPSQFADMAGLPRSSYSQILGGGLKKINSNIITKLHMAFPDLSIGWLLFDEGEMIVAAGGDSQQLENRQSEIRFVDESDVFQPAVLESSEKAEDFELTAEKSSNVELEKRLYGTLNGGFDMKEYTDRRIVKIMVFYDDNTFESFLPE